MTSDDELQSDESGSPAAGEPADEPHATPSAKYYRATGPYRLIVYVQEADRWHSHVPGGASLREGAGEIPEYILSNLEEMDEAEAKQILEAAPGTEGLRSPRPVPASISRQTALTGLGGWMVLPIVLLFLTLLQSLAVLLVSLIPLLRSSVWSALTTPGSAAYHPVWGPAIIFDVCATAVMIVLPVVLLVLIFQRRRVAPKFVIAFSFFILIARVADSVAVIAVALGSLRHTGYTETAGDMISAALTALLVALVLAAIWIPYFLVSKRVKNTFTRSRRSGESVQPRSWSRAVVASLFAAGATVAVVLVVLLSWGSATLSEEMSGLTTQSGGIKTYTDPDYGYRFDYPADWVLQRAFNTIDRSYEAPGTAFVYGNYGVLDGGVYLDMMGVLVHDYGVTFDDSSFGELKSELEAWLVDLAASVPGTQVLSPLSETAVGGLSGFTATFTDSFDGIALTTTTYWLFSETLEYDLMMQTKSANRLALEEDIAAFVASFSPGPED